MHTQNTHRCAHTRTRHFNLQHRGSNELSPSSACQCLHKVGVAPYPLLLFPTRAVPDLFRESHPTCKTVLLPALTPSSLNTGTFSHPVPIFVCPTLLLSVFAASPPISKANPLGSAPPFPFPPQT